jgi:hypothetical protein
MHGSPSQTTIANSQATLQLPGRVAHIYRVGDWLTIAGNAVEIYGAAGKGYGTYSVALDGLHPVVYNASAPSNTSQVLLVSSSHAQPDYNAYLFQYRADNLPGGNHTVVINNMQDAVLTIDYALARSYVDSFSTSVTALPIGSETASASHPPTSSSEPSASSFR